MTGFNSKRDAAADKLQEDQVKYGTSWSKDGERIDPMSVYKEPAQSEKEKISQQMTAEIVAARALAQPAQKIPYPVTGWKVEVRGSNQQLFITGVYGDTIFVDLPVQPAQEPVREALAHLKAAISAFGPDAGISLDKKGWSNLHAAIQTVVTQPAQEPAEWSWVCNECGAHEFLASVSESDLKFLSCGGCGCDEFHKENTASPPRPWVGLTDEDCKGMNAGDKVVAMWANRILKEKNT